MGIELVTVFNLLPAVIARLPGAVDSELADGAERMAQYAIDNHPWQNETGNTEASIHSEQTGDHEWSAIGGGALIFLEWGTVKMQPWPTMQPAYDAIAPTIGTTGNLESLLI